MKTYSAKEYMQVEIANAYGLDHQLFEDRIDWVNQNEKDLENLEDSAESMYEYAAAVLAYRDAQQGKPTGFMVGLDACASGIQMLSVLTKCATGCEASGVIGSTRKDPYTTTTTIMSDLLSAEQMHERADIKQALMTVVYGSEKTPKDLFGEDTVELKAFYKAARLTAPGAMKLLDLLKDLWDPEALSYSWTAPDGFNVRCPVKVLKQKRIEIDTLENHPTFTHQYYANEPIETGRFLAANIAHSIDAYIDRELRARCMMDRAQLITVAAQLQRAIKHQHTAYGATPPEVAWREHQCISLVGAEYAYDYGIHAFSYEYCVALLDLINKVTGRPRFTVVSIHDKFKCLANYMTWVRQMYIDLLSELSQGNSLNVILSAIAGKAVEWKPLDKNIHLQIEQAEYPLS